MTSNRLLAHQQQTRELAEALTSTDVYSWLIDHGYFPESHVLPPCFTVSTRPPGMVQHYRLAANGKYTVPRRQCVTVHFPKTNLTDRTFGVMDPRIHNDIVYHITDNWPTIVDAMVPSTSRVVSYSFPIPIDSKQPGRVGQLRSGRMIYEFLKMSEDDLAAQAYHYRFVVRADIKNFYPSIYTHSIAWALHGKKHVRANIHDFSMLGNRLDRLFQNANDGCTNGVPIGPVVSDIAAEIVASAVDVLLTKSIAAAGIACELVRYKDDYRVLVKSSADGHAVVKFLQAALKEYNLELSDDKTIIRELPDGLFRDWVSLYHAARPSARKRYSWSQFRELYLAVLRIDRAHPNTGVIDRFLADIMSRPGVLKVPLGASNLQKVISMLLMMASLRPKAFPKVVAILEAILKTWFGSQHREDIVRHLGQYLNELAKDEEQNKYLVTWICYFLVSNDLKSQVTLKHRLKDPITRSAWHNRSTVFRDCPDYKLFMSCRKVGRKRSLLEHLAIFDKAVEI